MKNLLTMCVGVVVVVVLLFYMVTYQVAFNEMAVVTTFGAAGDNAVVNATEDNKGSGLHFKWPSPIQSVYTYNKGIRLLESRLSEVNTKDANSVVVSAYITWKVSDPLAFYKALRTTEQAENLLTDKLRASHQQISAYKLSELTNKDPNALKLADAEQAIRQRIQSEATAQGYGVEIVSAGIKRIVFPEDVSKQVNETVKSTRLRLAETARSEGEALAQRITSDAERASKIILSFANQRAEAIRAEGDAAAAEFYPIYNQNEELAIFLRKLDAYKTIFDEGTTTFVLDAQDGIFDLFKKSQRDATIQRQQDKSTTK